jgi:hypothetical protein
MCCILGTRSSQVALDSGSIAIAKQGRKIHYTDSGKVTLSVSNNKKVAMVLILYQCFSNSTCVHQ